MTADDGSIGSRRKTSNSRGPGQEGTVRIYPSFIVRCPRCGGMRMDLEGPHSTRWLDGRLRDCVGDVVEVGR